MIIIYCVCKDNAEAEKISKHLLEKKLCACVNFFPIKSIYSWKGKIEKSDETALLIKTIQKNYKKIEVEIKKIHSYETPAIFSFNINNVEKDYLGWLSSEIRMK